jgi:hypothetical protein
MFEDIFAPRGQGRKGALGVNLLDRLWSAYDETSLTAPKYAREELQQALLARLHAEVEWAEQEFLSDRAYGPDGQPST